MARRRRIHPVVSFPVELPVEEEVLGMSFEVNIEGISLELTFPDSDKDEEWPSLVPPKGQSRDIHAQLVKESWGHKRNDSWLVQTVAASLLVTPQQNPRDTQEVGRLGDVFDAWFLRAREWILIRHGVPRAGLHRSRGTVVHGWDRREGRWGAGARQELIMIEGLRGGSIAEVRAAFDRATQRVSPPIQHCLLLDAKTAAVQGYNRRAAIDAGTAAEVAVASVVGDRFRAAGLDARSVDTIIGQAKGLADLVQLSDSLSVDLTISRKRVINELAGTRNSAAHGGLRPTDAETAAAIRCAGGIVAHATPLPFP